jgi:hypothetical protein
MYALVSRAKTNGKYTQPPQVDENNKTYGNRIDTYVDDVKSAESYVVNNGDKCRLYALCEHESTLKNQTLMNENNINEKVRRYASNGFYVIQRYAYSYGTWNKLPPLSNKNPVPI